MVKRTVGEVVKGRPVYVVQEDDLVLDAARYMTEYRVGAVPVLSDGSLAGIFSERDLMTRVVAQGLDPAQTVIREVMTTKVAVLGLDSTCTDALAVMRQLRIHHLPVVNGKRLVGFVSRKELQAVEQEAQEVNVEFLEDYVETVGRTKMKKQKQALADRVRAIPGGEHVYSCYSCGTCVANCMVQKVELTYNPRRLIQKVINGMEQESFEDKTTWLCSACDLCYPACPQKIHVSGVLGAVRDLAIEAGHTSTLRTAVVDESTCVACGLCVQVCPYEAVTLVEEKVAGQTRTRASVDVNRCMACGLCAASCRSASIELQEEFSNEALMEDLWGWLRWTEGVPSPMVETPQWAEPVPSSRPEVVQ
ncbi:MAG: CBS domain-containing protein [Chloroflexi bacterium]|jgi:heterodisulfide reductase subunit C/CBS domain-containing protein|nr:CBS domain-containing protein [Chloroflexota bacterium]